MSDEFEKCIRQGKIGKQKNGKNFVKKTLESAKADFETAVKSAKEKNYKWATVQAYYAMFNCGRALLYFKGYCEKNSHFCLIHAVKALYVVEKLLDISFVEAIQEGKDLREDANYHNNWDESSCKRLMKKAKKLILKTKELTMI